MTKIYKCPQCEDRDCLFNALGLCFNMDVLIHEIPSGMLTCSGKIIEFNRNDYEFYFLEDRTSACSVDYPTQ